MFCSRYGSFAAAWLAACALGRAATIGAADPTDSWWDTDMDVVQLYSAVVERCWIAGVAPPQIVETWYVPDATGATWAVVTTNAVAPFPFTVNGHSSTCFPYVTWAWMNQVDHKIQDLFASGAFVAVDTNADLNGWFSNRTGTAAYSCGGPGTPAWTQDVFRATPPVESMAGYFARHNLGHVRTTLTDAGGWVTNGSARFTQTTPSACYRLAEVVSSGAAWTLQTFNELSFVGTVPADGTALDSWQVWPSNSVAQVRVTTAGTNTIPAGLSVNIAGSYVTQGETWNSANFVQALSASNTPLLDPVIYVTAITPNKTMPTGSVIAVLWTNELVTFGGIPYRLTGTAYNERVACVRGLTRTWRVYGADDGLGIGNDFGAGTMANGAGADPTSAVAYAEQVADWPTGASLGGGGAAYRAWAYRDPNNDPRTFYQAQRETPTNWACSGIATTNGLAHSAQHYIRLDRTIPQYCSNDHTRVWDFDGLVGAGGVVTQFLYRLNSATYAEACTNRRAGPTVGTNNPVQAAWATAAEAGAVVDLPTDVSLYDCRVAFSLWVLDWAGTNGLRWR